MLLPLFFLAFTANAQSFKVIIDTAEYSIREVDSAYFTKHQIKPDYKYEDDTDKVKKEGTELILPLNNGKKMSLWDNTWSGDVFYCANSYVGEYKRLGLHLIQYDGPFKETKFVLLNKETLETDTITEIPYFSPSNQYYAFCSAYKKKGTKEIGFKDNKTNKKVCVNFNEFPMVFGVWTANDSFILCKIKYVGTTNKAKITNYYLVKIKQ